jgi:o-succinylbenzoate synthase
MSAALDQARLDIEGQRTRRSIAAILSPDPRPSIAVNALIFARDIEASATEAAEAVARGFGTVKLKVAVGPPERDIERIAEVRARIGAEARIRIDANGGWDEETALQVLRSIERYDIEYVEDPVAGDPSAIRGGTGIAIASDAPTRDRALGVIAEKGADVLILKPALVGGIRAAHEIACRAIDAGIGVVITSVFETAVGVAGGVHLAASLPGPERAHGLATVCLLEDHPVRGLEAPHDGMIPTPMLPGLGIDLEGITT